MNHTRLLAAFIFGSAITIFVMLLSDQEKNYGFQEDIDDLLDNVDDLISLP